MIGTDSVDFPDRKPAMKRYSSTINTFDQKWTLTRLKVVWKLLLWLINGGAERMSNKAGYIGESNVTHFVNKIDVINANELS